MRHFLLQITMPDGSQGRHDGLYSDGFDAVIHAMDLFPQAHHISARRIP